MRNSSEALKFALSNIKLAVQNGKYYVAARLATDLIKLAFQLESKTELFMGEVMEAVYLEIHHELDTYEIPDADKKELNENMIGYVDKLMVAYDKQDDLLDVLVDLRNDATIFQFTSGIKYKIIPSGKFRGSING